MEQKSLWDKLNDFMMKDSTFILLIMGAAASIFAATYLYINFGTGVFNTISIVSMLREGLDGGDYAAAAGFATGFLIARVLEGPLVGVLDIGGSLCTGVGIGIPAFFLSAGFDLPLSSFWAALLTGAIIGLIMGAIIMIVRKTVPEGVAVGGTSIMMGAGNTVGRYMAPLIVFAACQYNVYTGIGAILGSAIFYKLKKEVTGGAIIGAMILGGIFL